MYDSYDLIDFAEFDFSLKDLNLSNSTHGLNLPRHRWYLIKEAFSPHLVKTIIEQSKVSPPATVLDPFCGCGTVPVCSASFHIESIGFEVNPFLAFVSKAKAVNCSAETFISYAEEIIAAAKRGKESSLLYFSTFSEMGGNEKWLFNSDVLRAFEGGYSYSEVLDENIRDLYRLALLGAAMDNCNAYRDGKCLRYKSNWKSLNFNVEQFIKSLQYRIQCIYDDLALDDEEYKAPLVIHNGDSRKLIQEQIHQIDLCITSPPYLNSFDYSDVYRPELFLGKFVANNDELIKIRHQTLRSHVQVAWKLPERSDFGPIYDNCIDKIFDRSNMLWDKRIPFMIQAYFEDMMGILSELRCLVRAGSETWLIVSTSAYAGVEIPVDLILAEIGIRTGWNLKRIYYLRKLRAASHHVLKLGETGTSTYLLRESAVVLQAS